MSGSDFDRLITRCNEGDRKAFDELVCRLYKGIRAGARRIINGSSPNLRCVLQTNGLVNDWYLRVVRSSDRHFTDLQHFVCHACRTMRCIVLDYARALGTKKRDSRLVVSLNELDATAAQPHPDFQLVDILDVFRRLEDTDRNAAVALQLKYYFDLNAQQIASLTGRALRSTERDLRHARIWLRNRQ